MKSRIIGLLAFVALVVGMSQTAEAGFILTLDDLGTSGIDIIIVDNGAIDSSTAVGNSNTVDGSSGTAGIISFNGAVGAFIVNMTTAMSKPFLDGNEFRTMDLFSVNVSGGVGQLQISVTDTDFAPLPDAYLLTNIGGTTNGTIEWFSGLDPENGEFVGTPYFTSDTAVVHAGTGDAGAFASTQLTSVGELANPFSLSSSVIITHTNAAWNQVTSFDLEATVLPEPTSIALFGLGLVATGAVGWRNHRRKTEKVTKIS